MAIVKIEGENYSWLNLKNPKKDEVNHLAEKYNIHHLHLEDALNVKTQTPGYDVHRDYIHFVFHFPALDKKRGKIFTCEMDVFLKEDFLLTITTERIPFLNRLIRRLSKEKRRNQFLKRGPKYLLYSIIDKGIDWMFEELDLLGEELNKIDKEVFEAVSEEPSQTIRDISLLRRNLVIFQTAIKPQIVLFSNLEQGRVKRLNNDMRHYWGKATDHLKRLDERADDYRELTEGLSQNLESLLSHRTNEIIKILTVFSVIMLPLTLLSGIYGMNLIYLPLAKHPAAIFIITLFMLSLVAVMLGWFKSKKWI